MFKLKKDSLEMLLSQKVNLKFKFLYCIGLFIMSLIFFILGWILSDHSKTIIGFIILGLAIFTFVFCLYAKKLITKELKKRG